MSLIYDSIFLLAYYISGANNLQLLSISKKCSADEAMKIGLIDEIIPPDKASHEELENCGYLFLEPFLKQPYPGSIKAFKAAIDACDRLSDDEAVESEIHALASRWYSQDNIEALSKIKTK